jgi:hypothetical protein
MNERHLTDPTPELPDNAPIEDVRRDSVAHLRKTLDLPSGEGVRPR